MTRNMECALIGKWRIVEADPWDRDYLDLVEPAHITFGGNGHGDFAFGCVNGGRGANIPAASSSLSGEDSMKWTKSAAMVQPNSTTTAPLKSKSASTSATKLFLKRRNGDFFSSLLEQIQLTSVHIQPLRNSFGIPRE